MNFYKQAAVAAALLGLLASPSLAQINGGLITVNISNVANDIANNLHVDLNQIPVTVQVPIGIAATVCGIEANVIATGAQGTNCDATSTSNALNNLVQRQIR
jgi:hypothetical protein